MEAGYVIISSTPKLMLDVIDYGKLFDYDEMRNKLNDIKKYYEDKSKNTPDTYNVIVDEIDYATIKLIIERNDKVIKVFKSFEVR